jgi:hypothetical protein
MAVARLLGGLPNDAGVEGVCRAFGVYLLRLENPRTQKAREPRASPAEVPRDPLSAAREEDGTCTGSGADQSLQGLASDRPLGFRTADEATGGRIQNEKESSTPCTRP